MEYKIDLLINIFFQFQNCNKNSLKIRFCIEIFLFVLLVILEIFFNIFRIIQWLWWRIVLHMNMHINNTNMSLKNDASAPTQFQKVKYQSIHQSTNDLTSQSSLKFPRSYPITIIFLLFQSKHAFVEITARLF